MSCARTATMLLAAALFATAADPAPAPQWTSSAVAPAPGKPDGYVQFQKMCAVCHGAGPGKPGTRALQAKYQGTLPALLEERRDLTVQLVTYTVRHGVSVMPPLRKTELSDTDMEAIAAYLTRKRR